MSTYWPPEQALKPTLVRRCRFCGDTEASFHPGARGCECNGFGAHEYVEINDDRLGPTGPGTPGARMRWLWDRLHEHEAWLIEHGGYEPFSSSSTGMIEAALVRALAKVDPKKRGEA